MHAFILAMALYPEVQKKAQAELDAVVGTSRLPTFSDRDSLPYISALAKEVIRWHVVAPIGVPHRSKDDDVYDDYYIPGGSIVMVNQWYASSGTPHRAALMILGIRALSRDETMYPDPERFDPERFLVNGRLNPEIRDPGTYAFGFGRRYV